MTSTEKMKSCCACASKLVGAYLPSISEPYGIRDQTKSGLEYNERRRSVKYPWLTLPLLKTCINGHGKTCTGEHKPSNGLQQPSTATVLLVGR
jgi:hypothetical protein